MNMDKLRENKNRINKRRDLFHQDSLSFFGPNLGESYYQFFNGADHSVEAVQARTLDLAEKVVSAIETGSHDEKVLAIAAILSAAKLKSSNIEQPDDPWIGSRADVTVTQKQFDINGQPESRTVIGDEKGNTFGVQG